MRLEVGGWRSRENSSARRCAAQRTCRSRRGWSHGGRALAGGPSRSKRETHARRGAWFSPNTPTAGHTANHVRSVRARAVRVVHFGVPPSRGTVVAASECLLQPARVIGLRSGIGPSARDQPFLAGCGLLSTSRPRKQKCMQGEPPDRSTGRKCAVTDPLRRAL